MPITFDMCLGTWEFEYKKKEADADGHRAYALGHTKEEFDQALIVINAYEEYYGHGYKLEPRPNAECEQARLKGDYRTVNVIPVPKPKEDKPILKYIRKYSDKPKSFNDSDLDFMKSTLDANASSQLGNEQDKEFYRCLFGIFNKLYYIANPRPKNEKNEEKQPVNIAYEQASIFDFI